VCVCVCVCVRVCVHDWHDFWFRATHLLTLTTRVGGARFSILRACMCMFFVRFILGMCVYVRAHSCVSVFVCLCVCLFSIDRDDAASASGAASLSSDSLHPAFGVCSAQARELAQGGVSRVQRSHYSWQPCCSGAYTRRLIWLDRWIGVNMHVRLAQLTLFIRHTALNSTQHYVCKIQTHKHPLTNTEPGHRHHRLDGQ